MQVLVTRSFRTFSCLNEQIEDAERTVASTEQNVRSCEQSIQRAVAALQRINDEVARLNTLGNKVHAQETTLQASATHGQALRTCSIDPLGVSPFVGNLAVHYTEQQFAQGL